MIHKLGGLTNPSNKSKKIIKFRNTKMKYLK